MKSNLTTVPSRVTGCLSSNSDRKCCEEQENEKARLHHQPLLWSNSLCQLDRGKGMVPSGPNPVGAILSQAVWFMYTSIRGQGCNWQELAKN
jgi:hypothetical protein